jgi:hypothetical protein
MSSPMSGTILMFSVLNSRTGLVIDRTKTFLVVHLIDDCR